MSKSISLSALQPSGRVTLGNYLGAIKNWIDYQSTHQCYYCLVDLHALTNLPDPKTLKELSLEGLAIYIACGLDPDKSTLFVQSHVSEHVELSWVLNCLGSMGELSRMTQFKDKTAKQKQVGVGLFVYPLLMAADILLYDTDIVPVGNDQKQHIELCRDVAGRFNHQYKCDLFKLPKPVISKSGARIMSLSNPKNKMSKSDTDPNATIFLTDDEKSIMNKFKKAVTDSETEIKFDVENKSGVSNLLEIQKVISGKTIKDLENSYQGKMYGHLKVETAQMVIDNLAPIQKSYNQLISDKGQLEKILKAGAIKAKEQASKKLAAVYEKIGLISK